MTVHKVVAGSVLAAGLGMAGLFGAGMASADVVTNGTTNDAQGFAVTNHMKNGWNGDENGIGHLRSAQTGAQVSGNAGRERVQDVDPHTWEWQDGNPDNLEAAPISNKGGNNVVKVGNGR